MGKVGSWNCAANDWACICGKGELMTDLDSCGVRACEAGVAPAIVNQAHTWCASECFPKMG